MALAEDQVLFSRPGRTLLMGEGTRFDVQSEFNPFRRSVRAPQAGDQPYAHGSYTGAEWQNEVVTPVRVIINGADRDVQSCRVAVQEMTAVLAAVGDAVTSPGQVMQLRFRLAGDTDEFVMFGTPRGFEPDLSTMGEGWVYASGSFVSQDPRVYSGAETSVEVALPVQSGGLTVPVTAPVAVSGQLVGGRVSLTNSGTSAAPLTARINGPVVEPGIVLQRPDGSVQSVRLDLTLLSGQWLDIDSVNRTAYLNGLVTANQRPSAAWQMDAYPILPGTTRVRFTAGEYDAAAGLSLSTRSAWL